MLHKNSCFLECLARLLGEDPQDLHEIYLKVTTGAKPEECGYHPQVFAFRLSYIEIAPCNHLGEAIVSGEQAQERFNKIVEKYPTCILVGPRANGSEHAILMDAGKFWCPAEGDIVEPNIGIRSAWVKR